MSEAGAESERRLGDCECGHHYDFHTQYTSGQHCSMCDCDSYGRSLFHWVLDTLGHR